MLCHFSIGILGQVWYLIYRFLIFAPLLTFILVKEIVMYTGKSPLEILKILWDTETVPYQLIL